MARKKDNKLAISNRSMDDFIWMSYRYCIGRHTIAAAHHAETIHSVIRSNPDMLSDDRKAFNAKDIRAEITTQIAFYPNVYINGRHDFDAYTLLLIEGSKYKDNCKGKRFFLDSYKNELSLEDYIENSYTSTFDKDFIDLIPWVRLANYLDVNCHYKITVNFNNEIQDYICYQYPVRQTDGTYQLKWCDINDDVTITRYLDEQYITNIEKCN